MKLQQKSPNWFSLPKPEPHRLRAQEVAQSLLLERYAPPSVLIDKHCECVGFFGQVQPYLSLARNEEDSNLFAIAHESLRARLKAALKFVWFDDGPARADEGAAERNVHFDSLTIGVVPIRTVHGSFLLVSFLAPARLPETHAPLRGGGGKQPAPLELLSPRQRAVLDLVVNGRSNKQIAGDLGISRRTVETHRVIVMRKLGARNFADLMRLVAAA